MRLKVTGKLKDWEKFMSAGGTVASGNASSGNASSVSAADNQTQGAQPTTKKVWQ